MQNPLRCRTAKRVEQAVSTFCRHRYQLRAAFRCHCEDRLHDSSCSQERPQLNCSTAFIDQIWHLVADVQKAMLACGAMRRNIASMTRIAVRIEAVVNRNQHARELGASGRTINETRRRGRQEQRRGVRLSRDVFRDTIPEPVGAAMGPNDE